MDDRQASELITKSLSGYLSADEEQQLQIHLEANRNSEHFAKLSQVIQRAARHAGAETLSSLPHDETPISAESDSLRSADSSPQTARLSEAAKQRMREAIDAQQREAFLNSGGEAEHLLVASETAYYSAPEASAQGSAGSNSPSSGAEDHRQAFSRFTLLHKIGAGGLGTVWLARDELLKRNVALKEMNANAARSPKLWKRFAREAEITAHLEHPNVVPLYLSGVHPTDGRPFYAMRFLGKQTLADAIAEYHARRQENAADPIQFHRLLAAFLDVCQAIAFAHSRGVIHRDLKPENVALNSFGQVLVLDWGLAKLDTDGELATRLALSGSYEEGSLAETLDGDVIGTPMYMAPEQAAGDMDKLDERTDIYGLGAILFAILTGAAPHHSSVHTDSGNVRLKDMLAEIAQRETPKPRDLNPDIPYDLAAICIRAMSKQRFARQESAQALAAEVEGWIAGRHHRQTRYDAMRMTGRDLKSRLCVQLKQLAVIAQFMVELPPIQGLVANLETNEEKFHKWREGLSTVFMALGRAKTNLSGLSFCKLSDNHVQELVRVERSLLDVSNIRSLPQSRLRRGAANTFQRIVLEQFPGESCLDLDFATAGVVRLVAGVPVFDAATEEPFGLVLAEAELGSLVRPEIAATESKEVIYLVDDKQRILFSTRHAKPAELRAETEIACWPQIKAAIDKGQDYVEADREFYATRLSFPQENNSITIVLQVAQ